MSSVQNPERRARALPPPARVRPSFVRRAALGGLVPLVLFALPSCNKPLGEADCKKLVDKMVDLLADTEEKAEKVKPTVKADKALVATLRETCVGKMTRAQYDCILAAKTFEAAAACDAK